MSSFATDRFESVKLLLEHMKKKGAMSSESISFEMKKDSYGSFNARASKIINEGTHLIYSPLEADLTFDLLSSEIDIPWKRLDGLLQDFDMRYEWNDNTSLFLIDFCKNIKFVICIFGLIHKLNIVGDSKTKTLNDFEMYWNSLPSKELLNNNILYDWIEGDLCEFKKTSFFRNCFADGQRYGREMFDKVISPFFHEFSSIFGNEEINFQEVVNICSIINCRTFSGQYLLPMVDLINGKSSGNHNCYLETIEGENEVLFHALISSSPIKCNDEIFIEYPLVSLGEYLVNYHHVPSDRDMTTSNTLTCIYLYFKDFFMQTSISNDIKLDYFNQQYHFPQVLSICLDDIIDDTRGSIDLQIFQFLLLIQCSDQEFSSFIEKGIPSYDSIEYDTKIILHLFLQFIDFCLEVPDCLLYKDIFDDSKCVLNQNIRSSLYLQIGEHIVIESLILKFIEFLKAYESNSQEFYGEDDLRSIIQYRLISEKY